MAKLKMIKLPKAPKASASAAVKERHDFELKKIDDSSFLQQFEFTPIVGSKKLE